ncbi:MAG: DNA repair protein RadA [Candidatus Omnitrophica bacterium]|nr:DNA repair protein RadA [Candidatus Omnitrophota bacterium]
MFHCTACGYKSVKWLGKCPLCEGWETFAEEAEVSEEHPIVKEKTAPKLFGNINEKKIPRILTGIEGFDRILGGGIVNGETVLIGGEPGVGKSTLLLEVAGKLSFIGKTLYVSAEESPEQVSVRADRLRPKEAPSIPEGRSASNKDQSKSDFSRLYILGEDDLGKVYEHIESNDFKFVIIDSIQVVYSSRYEGAKGSVSQIKGCADYLTQIAKIKGCAIFIVGHVTKDGAIAGPKLLEHIVDCVFYFEGEMLSDYRLLRATKNRFGPTGDIVVFEMSSNGLKEVKKLDEIFLPHQSEPVSGSSVVCVIEGLRPLLVELQSLVSKASFGVVRRRSLGFDFNRFSLLVAIIEKRLKISLSAEDIFLNVAGGLRINDPAADLGACVAMLSSLKDKALPSHNVFIGEVGLGGELRRVNNINLRLKELARASTKRAFIASSNLKEVDKSFRFAIEGFGQLKDVVNEVFH